MARYAVKPRTMFYADAFKTQYADGWCIVCLHCRMSGKQFPSLEEATAALVASSSKQYKLTPKCRLSVAPAVGEYALLEPENITVIWHPGANGTTMKLVLDNDSFVRTYEKVEG